jgi:branched-chain amino acid transport system permease protein
MDIVSQIVFNIIVSATIFSVISFSFSIIYLPAKFFNISHAITLTISAYLTYFFSQQLHTPIWLAILLAIVFATFVGIFSEIFIYKPLRKRNGSPMTLMVASLGLYIVVQNLISMLWGDDTRSVRTGGVKAGHEFCGAYITDIQIVTIAVGTVLLLVFMSIMKRSRIGRNIRAIGNNSILSNIWGINSERIILYSFAIGSSLASVAGILIAYDTDMTPMMGFNWLLYGIVAMIIGGVGSYWGLIGGSLLLSTARFLAAYQFGSEWMDAVAYVILILFLIWRPLGLSGKRIKKVEI